MANEIQIRVTGRNDAGAAVGGARRELQETERAAQGVQRAADRAAAAQLAARRATLAAAEAQDRANHSAGLAAAAQEALARGNITEAEAARLATQAERDLERAQIAHAAAAQRSSEAVRRQAEHNRLLAESSRDADREQRRMGDGAERNHGLFSRIGDAASKAGDAFKNLGQKGVESAVEMTGRGGPYAALAEIAAILTVLPIAAEAAGAGIVLGVGGGLSGLAIKVATTIPRVQAEFKAMAGDVKGELQDMVSGSFEPQMMRISRIAQGTFERLAPSLRAAFARMAPQVGDFAQHLGDALAKFEPMIDRLSVAFGPMLAQLGQRLPDIAQHIGDAFAKIGEKVDPKSLDMLIDAIDGTIVALREVIVFLEDTGNKISWVYDKIKVGADAVGRLFQGKGDAKTYGTALADVSRSALDAASSINDLKRQIAELATQTLAARDTHRAFEAAIDDAAEAAKKNGRTLDINSAKGRANQAALDGIASSALAMRDAMDKSGQDSSKAMERARAKFIDTAMSMGQSRKAAERLADRLGLVKQAAERIPKSRQLTIKDNANVRRQAINLLSGAIRGMPSQKTVTVSIRTLGMAALQSARNLLSSIPGAAGGYAHGGIVGAAATGGPRSGMVLVGEQGPELVKLAPGSTVTPHGQSMSAMADLWSRQQLNIWGRDELGWSRKALSPWERAASKFSPPDVGVGQWRAMPVDPYRRGYLPPAGGFSRGYFTPGQTTGPGGGGAPTGGGSSSGGGGGGDVRVVLEFRSGSHEIDQLFVKLLRKYIRVHGGNVQTVLGRH